MVLKRLKSLKLKETSFSRTNLLIFVAVFAAIGGYILWSSLAATSTKTWDTDTDFSSGTLSGTSVNGTGTAATLGLSGTQSGGSAVDGNVGFPKIGFITYGSGAGLHASGRTVDLAIPSGSSDAVSGLDAVHAANSNFIGLIEPYGGTAYQGVIASTYGFSKIDQSISSPWGTLRAKNSGDDIHNPDGTVHQYGDVTVIDRQRYGTTDDPAQISAYWRAKYFLDNAKGHPGVSGIFGDNDFWSDNGYAWSGANVNLTAWDNGGVKHHQVLSQLIGTNYIVAGNSTFSMIDSPSKWHGSDPNGYKLLGMPSGGLEENIDLYSGLTSASGLDGLITGARRAILLKNDDGKQRYPMWTISPSNSSTSSTARLGLSASTIAGAYFLGAQWTTPDDWWMSQYDTYGRHWMGLPMGEPVQVKSGLWYRKFEHANAIANTTGSPQTVLGVTVANNDGALVSANNGTAPSGGGSGTTTYPASGTAVLSFDAGSSSTWSNLVATDSKPSGTNVVYDARTSTDNTNWSAWTSSANIASIPAGRYIQVRATLSTTNTAATPSVDKISVDYNPSSTTPPPSGTFTPEVGRFYLTHAEIQAIKDSVNQNAWAKTAWNNIKSKADTALSASPNPAAGGSTDYSTNWDTTLYPQADTDGVQAYSLAMAYAVTGTTSYGDKTKQFLLAWARTYNPPATNTGHYAAEGYTMERFFWAYDMAQDRFSASEQSEFKTWAKYFIARGEQRADSMRDGDYSNCTPTPCTVTIGSETSNWQNFGGNEHISRALAATAAGAVGGTDLTNFLNWNWQHTTPGGKANGWLDQIEGTMAKSGETYEGHVRTIGYGASIAQQMEVIADVAKHAGYTQNLFTATTTTGKSLLLPWQFYGPYLTFTTAWPTTDGDYTNRFDKAAEKRAAAEVAYRNSYGTPFYNILQSVVNYGGDTQRGNNYDGHFYGYNAITGEILMGGTTTPPPPSGNPTITQNITAGQTLSGTVTWTATVTSGASSISKIVFAMDGNTNNTTVNAPGPYQRVLDTTTLTNGTHSLGLTVTLTDGTVVWQPYQVGNVTINNVTPAKTGDLNGDNQVNILDLSIMLSHYGTSATATGGDLNGDGQVNILDLSVLLNNWGK